MEFDILPAAITKFTADHCLDQGEIERRFGLTKEVGYGGFIVARPLGKPLSPHANRDLPATRCKIASDKPVLLNINEQARVRRPPSSNADKAQAKG